MQRLIVRPARWPAVTRAVTGGELVIVGFVLLGSPVTALAGWVPLLGGAVLAGLSLRAIP
jgi:hypothetical protein